MKHDAPLDDFESQLLSLTPRPLSDEAAESIRQQIADDATPPRRLRAWWAIAPLAAAACVVLAFTLIGPGDNNTTSPDLADNPDTTSPDTPASAPSITLANWQVQPTGDADYTILDKHSLRLDNGELLIESTQADDGTSNAQGLTVITPNGNAHAKGTRFYIGTHADPTPTNQKKEQAMKRLTRVLILSGIVTLTNPLGSITGQPNELLAAEADTAPAKVVATSNTQFAIDLYKQLASEKEQAGKNIFFSPYSITGALTMTMEGARGKTMQEMGNVLHFPKESRHVGGEGQYIPWQTSQIHSGFGQINARLNEKLSDAERKEIEGQIATLQTELKGMQEKASKKWDRELNAEITELVDRIKMLDGKVNPPKLAVANALWGEQTFPFREEYVDTISTSYKTGGLFPIDFAKNPEPSRLHINGWVEDQTNNRIKNLIPEGDINERTKLVLTNAIYFKGNWTNPFNKKMTRTRDFTRADGSKVQAPIMFGRLPVKLGGQKIAEGTHVSVAELPYVGDELSMVLITASGGQPLSTVEKHLTTANLDKWLGTLEKGYQKIHVSLPRFKMESKYKLNDTLKAMGMPTAFQRGGADFSGLNESYGKLLFIGSVHHKGFIDVNEAGTEAAAATAVVVGLRSMPPSFDGTRPFIYLIRDNATGTILFMGRMMDPTAQ